MGPPKSQPVKRYIRRVAGLMALYLLAVFTAKWTFENAAVDGPLAYALAIAPALPLIGVFWAVMRYIAEESDEYIRMLVVRQCLFATGFSLTIVTIWEWLQNFDLAPASNAGFGAAAFWFIGLGVGALYNKLTLGDWGNLW